MFQHDIFAIFLLATTLYNLILICALCKWRKRSFADWLCWFVFGVCWRWQIYDLEMVEMLLKNIKYIMTWNMIAFLHFFRPFFKSDLFIVNKMLFYLNFSELTFAEQKTNLPSVIGNMCSLKATCVFISKKNELRKFVADFLRKWRKNKYFNVFDRWDLFSVSWNFSYAIQNFNCQILSQMIR